MKALDKALFSLGKFVGAVASRSKDRYAYHRIVMKNTARFKANYLSQSEVEKIYTATVNEMFAKGLDQNSEIRRLWEEATRALSQLPPDVLKEGQAENQIRASFQFHLGYGVNKA